MEAQIRYSSTVGGSKNHVQIRYTSAVRTRRLPDTHEDDQAHAAAHNFIATSTLRGASAPNEMTLLPDDVIRLSVRGSALPVALAPSGSRSAASPTDRPISIAMSLGIRARSLADFLKVAAWYRPSVRNRSF